MKRMRQMAKRWMAVCIAASMIWTAGSQYAYAGVLPEGRPERPPLVEPAVKKQVLVNGEFEIPVDEFGQIEGWDVELSKKEGQWNKVWVEVYKNWEDSSNDSKKLAIYNGLEEDLHFSISQKIASSGYRTGIYTASVIYEGDDGRSGGVSDITFRVNGAQVKFEKLEGIMHWKQAQIGNLALQEGEPLTVEISGVLKESGALNMDDVLLTPAEQFVPRVFTPPAGKEAHPPYEPVREAAPQEAEKNIQNGSFDQPMDWGVNGYPKGYLPGWTIDAEHMERWDYKIDDGMFEVKNTGGMEGIEEFALSQKVRLGVGEYTLNAESYRGWDEASREGVCMRVADPDGVLIAERYWSPGIGFMISDPFRIDQEKEVTVSFTFQLPEGKSCSLDRVNIYPHPNKIQWTSAVQTGGRSGKADTEKIRLHFSQPVYKLKKEHFSLSGASIEDLEQEDRTTYALVLGDLTAQNDTKLTLKLKDPEYTDISPKKREVTVYRDDDGIEPMANTDFSQEVSWDREDYPDGYLPGWNLPVMDWKTWSYGVRGGIFEVSNIREAGGEARFSMNQVMKLPKGRYTIEGSSPYVRDENNPRGIWAEVKEGNRTLARVGTYPGCGIFRSEVFELEEETIVNYKVEFTLAGGKTAALDYITITPPGSVEEKELPTDLINGDFSTGVDWSLPGYPDGYVEGWTLPQPFDWERWRYVANGGSGGVFEVISQTGGGEEFSISQRIMLSAGTYVLAASSPYAYGGANREGVALTLSSDEKVIIAAAGQAGGGRFESGEFTITQDTPVTVTVTLSPGAANAGIAIDDVEIYEAGVIVSAQWISAVQTGGEDGVTDTDGISIVFDKDIPGLTRDNFTVVGADKGRLHSYGSGDYWLEISGIDVDSGHEVNVSVRAPGYRISPSEMHVTVYSQSTGSLPDQIVNGDFSEGVDWDKGGALPGWTIEGVDWNTWSSYSGTGGEYGNFWVVRSGETSDVPLELWQEVTLPAGRYILKADSQGDWNGDLTNAITLTAEGSGGDELAKKSVQPGYGAFETDAFELDDEDTVKVTVTFVLPPGKEMGVDNVEIIGAASNGQLLSLDADLILEATPSEAVPKEDDLEDAPVGEDEFLDATPSEAVPMEKPEAGAPGPETPEGGTPDTGAPGPETPEAGTPDTGAPGPETPEGGTPEAGAPGPETPEGGTPEAGAPGPETPEGGTPNAGAPGPEKPEGGTPDTGAPGPEKPEGGTPDAGAPGPETPEGGTPDTGAPGPEKPEGGTPDAGAPGPETPEGGTPDTGAPGPEKPEGGTPDAGAPGPETPEGGTPDTGAPGPEKPEGGTPDAGAPGPEKPEGGTPDAGAPGPETPEAGTPDAGAPGPEKPEGGTPDAGAPGLEKPEGGTPDAGAPGPETPEGGTPDTGAPGPETPEGGNRKTGNANAGKSEPYGSGKSSSVTIPEPPLSTGALPGGTGKSQQEGDEE